MSPELRFAAQLNRLSRALEQAVDVAEDLDLIDTNDINELEYHANAVRAYGRMLVELVAERGSAKSAT